MYRESLIAPVDTGPFGRQDSGLNLWGEAPAEHLERARILDREEPRSGGENSCTLQVSGWFDDVQVIEVRGGAQARLTEKEMIERPSVRPQDGSPQTNQARDAIAQSADNREQPSSSWHRA
jgi:hypothetical protein